MTEEQKELRRAKDREYKKMMRAANPEKYRETERNWRKNNLERARATEREWRKNNPEKKSKSDRRYRENNPDKCQKTNASYRKNNIDTIRSYEIKRGSLGRQKLDDNYIKRILAGRTSLKWKDIPQELIEAKRAELKVNRFIKSIEGK